MLFSILAVLATVQGFEPTNEWQAVAEDEPIPGGMDVQLNMETGERFVRLPQDDVDQAPKYEIASLTPSHTEILGNLDAFEDLAYDIDRGHEIIKNHFAALQALASSSDQRADQAAKIIQTALRHNPYAVKSLLEQDPSYPWSLIGDLENLSWRQLGIYSSIISTELGYGSCLLYNQRLLDKFASVPWENSKLLKRFESMAEDMMHMQALEGWSKTIQQAILSFDGDVKRQEAMLRALAKVHVLEPKDVTTEFLQWLSKVSYEKNSLGEYAKEVRYDIFGNPKARRVHEEL